MYCGIDVGGTHTDAVVVDRGEVLASCKVLTDHRNLLLSVHAALEDVCSRVKAHRIERITLSTTLSTNAIVEGKTEDAGILVSSGPGIDPESFRHGKGYFVIPGSIDHRGYEIQPLEQADLKDTLTMCRELGLGVYAVVGKFSTRNPAHELQIAQALQGQADHVTMGHRLSGLLNFPRRIATAAYNAQVWRLYNRFVDAVETSLRELGLEAQVGILKADGGTMPLAASRARPVESILSGPAASVMGMLALCDIYEDAILLDIGGTTTDIALLSQGTPVVEEGIAMGSYPTLVRALKTRSIGVGGDSMLTVRGGTVFVGPRREGPSMAQGGHTPTLIDACNYLRITSFRDREASRRGIEKLAALWDMYPEKLARAAVDRAVAAIKEAALELVREINEKPVYTIHELLKGKTLDPRRAYLMGGPAMVFRELLEQAFGFEVEAPQHYEVANAVGAALTRTTAELELTADTERRQLVIPSQGRVEEIPPRFTLEDAKARAKESLLAMLEGQGLKAREEYGDEVEFTEVQSFNMVDFYGAAHKNIRVKCQIKPGISE